MSLMDYLPTGNTLTMLEIGGFVGILYIAHRVSKKFKKKRVFSQCEKMQADLSNKQAKRFLLFLKWYTLGGIKTPDVAWALVETQKKINASPDITGDLKRRIYRQLKRKRIIDAQEVVRYYIDKDGRKVY